jgi:chemotaxis protein CheC
MRSLSELEEEALKEVFNIGFGYAASSLSQMVDGKVTLTVPALQFFSGDAMLSQLPDEFRHATMVAQRFEGGLRADAVLVFPEQRTLDLARLMISDDLSEDELGELEHEALTEVGNVVLNTSISVISDMLNMKFHCEMPRYLTGSFVQLLPEAPDEEDCLLILSINMGIVKANITGQMVFVMKVNSIDEFLPPIMKHLGVTA